MPRATPIFHSKLFDRLDGFLPQVVTVQANAPTRDSAGQPIASWTDVTGLANLSGRISPVMGQGEIRRADDTIVIATHVVYLGGDRAITEAHRLMVDGLAYDVLLVQKNAERALTQVKVRRVT